MRTYVRLLPERVAVVSLDLSWGAKNHRDPHPELLAPAELGVVILGCGNGDPVIERRYTLRGGDLAIAADHLIDLGLPIVGFNLLRFDWLSLCAHCDVDELVPRSIDLYSVLYAQVREIVDAEGSSAMPRRGDYGVLNLRRLARMNLGDAADLSATADPVDAYDPISADDPVAQAELIAALWHKLVTTERAVIAGRVYGLADDETAILRGETLIFDSAGAWRQATGRGPALTPYSRRTRHPVTFPRLDQRYV